MIYIRNDDVLLPSSGWLNKEFGRFKYVHEIIENGGDRFLHRPGIICNTITGFPECIEFIREKVGEGKIAPQFHGLDHIDYGRLSKDTIKEHILKGIDFINNNFNYSPEFFYTPWGASAPHIYEAAEGLIEVIDCSKLIRPLDLWKRLSVELYEEFDEKEIMVHWWEGMGRLEAICKTLGGTNGN